MSTGSAVGLIAYPAPDEAWAETVASTADGDLVLVVSDPPDTFSAPYADSVLRTADRIGFGRSRRLSMILTGEFGEKCVVTDGDGQYVASEIGRIQRRLRETDADVVIPQRESRTIWMEYDGEWVSRTGFERLETLCAGQAAGVDLDPSFDCQPGGFGFDRRVLPGLLPTSDWLADWEITVAALSAHEYETIDIAVSEEAQEETTFSWDDQIAKLRRITAIADVNVREVFDRHRDAFDSEQRRLIDAALNTREGGHT